MSYPLRDPIMASTHHHKRDIGTRGATAKTRGMTLLEILIAFSILGLGVLPIFRIMSQSRTVIFRSVLEVKAMSAATSVIDALHRSSGASLLQFPSRELALTDLTNYQIRTPPIDSSLSCTVQVKAITSMNIQDRFNQPWGQVMEMIVRVRSTQKGSRYCGKVVLQLRDIRRVDS